jgi:hypothetical protein
MNLWMGIPALGRDLGLVDLNIFPGGLYSGKLRLLSIMVVMVSQASSQLFNQLTQVTQA